MISSSSVRDGAGVRSGRVTLLRRGFNGSFLAEEVLGPERDRLFQFAAGASSPYGHYQQSAPARPIAVIAFRPIG
jgi:hypothetical protein